ncbi:MAG TPA: CCA tRNA nucleotidyltransferase [Planctomicrobium sp.]|nr:CCA tRNA nucleotidyltransferase [Planctomicrobium sp.]
MSQQFATSVVHQLVQAGFIAYWAGGCVRDLLRGVFANDYDVATNATPDQVRTVFGHRRTLAVGESFGVIIVLGPKGSGHSVEVATFREEGEYTDGRHPGRVSFCTPEEDAQRRDFTINGMFYDPLTQTVHDFVGGEEDLRQGIVRAIGDPRHRMTEDKLRMLRAVRFVASLGFRLEDSTAEAIREMAPQVTVVSAERIAQELRKMLSNSNRARAMRLCDDLGLLSYILPEVGELTAGQQQLLEQLSTIRFETAFAALSRHVPVAQARKKGEIPAGTVNAACARLKLSNDETGQILWLRTHFGKLAALPEQPISALKRLAVHPLWVELLELERSIAKVEESDQSSFEWIERQLAAIPPEELDPPALLNGSDLIQQGYKSGPQFKDWLSSVRDAQLNGDLHTTADALEFVKQLASVQEPS